MQKQFIRGGGGGGRYGFFFQTSWNFRTTKHDNCTIRLCVKTQPCKVLCSFAAQELGPAATD